MNKMGTTNTNTHASIDLEKTRTSSIEKKSIGTQCDRPAIFIEGSKVIRQHNHSSKIKK